MAAFEWPLCTQPGYVNTIIPIATSVDHSAWGISWAETQKQCIHADADYQDGYHDIARPPTAGLAAARIIAMLTYRSCVSFDRRFGRKPPPKETPRLPSDGTGQDVDNAVKGVNDMSQNPICDTFRSNKRVRVDQLNWVMKPLHSSQSPMFSV